MLIVGILGLDNESLKEKKSAWGKIMGAVVVLQSFRGFKVGECFLWNIFFACLMSDTESPSSCT
jgi:hypothetical protein